ncbi:MAG: CDP-2,3-bis-(O-geranylgeranyl)-sn-glycerol synthase [Candidatus Diapherotrites archaeon]|nr:CDP-2,3-bis-(O-geranylgeranyl)-sn-glycerol synthase [Candidatus Diapherotrites archaeon]
MIEVIAGSLWFILPAYVSNASAVLFKGKTPIDGGIVFIDGRRLLGKGKTVKGFVLAVLAGVLVGVAQGWLESDLLPRVALAFLLGLGTMSGDAVGSFIKRRFDLKQGDAAPLLDQWGFVLFAMGFARLGALFLPVPSFDFIMALAVLVITPVLHVGSNIVAYKLGLKGVPW